MQLPTIVNLPSTHYSSRSGAPIAAIVIHHTAGTDSRSWLVRNPRGVSAHVLISRAPLAGPAGVTYPAGTIFRLVPDDLAAHHVGFSRIVAGGRVIDRTTVPDPNQVTLGVELENLGDGKQEYTPEQLSALGWQLAEWSRRYPHARLVMHREIDTQGKSDPAGLDWPAAYRAMAPWLGQLPPTDPVAPRTYTAESPIIAPPGLAREQLARALARRCYQSPYGPDAVFALGETYFDLCSGVGVDPVVAAAQLCHETGDLNSWWSLPPRHNPAGIGVTGEAVHESQATPRGLDWAGPDATGHWRRGISFPDLEAGARAQVGRLLAYALPPSARFGPQVDLADEALQARPLPLPCQGSAPTLRPLGSDPNPAAGCGWAHPGTDYGARLAAVANALVRLA